MRRLQRRLLTGLHTVFVGMCTPEHLPHLGRTVWLTTNRVGPRTNDEGIEWAPISKSMARLPAGSQQDHRKGRWIVQSQGARERNCFETNSFFEAGAMQPLTDPALHSRTTCARLPAPTRLEWAGSRSSTSAGWVSTLIVKGAPLTAGPSSRDRVMAGDRAGLRDPALAARGAHQGPRTAHPLDPPARADRKSVV